MNAIIQYFIERWPIITIIILFIIGIVWLAVWITKRAMKADILVEKFKQIPCEEHTAKIDGLGCSINKLEDRIEKVEEKIEKVEVRMEKVEVRMDKLEVRMDKLEVRMDKLEDTTQNIDKNVIAIQTFLQTKFRASAPVFSQKYSPRRLNEKGKEMYEEFGGKAFLDANGEMLMELMSAKKPKTALDVEQGALDVLYETLDNDIFNTIKLKIYNSKDIEIEDNGKKVNYSLTMSDICFIFSLDLRDRYLNKHPEVPQVEE